MKLKRICIPPGGDDEDMERRKMAEQIVESVKVVNSLLESAENYRQSIVNSTGIQISEKEMIGLYFYWRGDVHDLTRGFSYLRDNKVQDDGNEVTKTVDSSPATVDSDSTNFTNKRALWGDSSPGDSTNTNKRAKFRDLSVRAHEHPELCGSFGMARTSLQKCTSLMTMPEDKISAEEKSRWVDLCKKYLQYFKVPESMFPNQSDIATGVVPDPVSCAWLFEPNWHDQAYQELLSIRNMHSLLLEKEYMYSIGERFKSLMDAKAHKKHLKKLLNFIGSSRDEIGALTKEDCYDCLMGVKCVVAYNAKQDASQLGNWRDQTYERLQCLRKMYSCMLDDAYEYVYRGATQSKQLMQYKEECMKFLEKSLNFLGNSRADMVYLPEYYCNMHLKDIERFVDGDDSEFFMRRVYLALRKAASFSSSHTQQEISSPNWRDQAYEKVISMREGFPLQDYKFCHALWSEIPELHESVEELHECIEGTAGSFFSVSRYTLAHLTRDGYARLLKNTTQVFERIEVLVSLLQKVKPVKL